MPLFVEHPNRNGFIGASGIGEMANIPIAPTIMNIIAGAIGPRIDHFPAHMGRVFMTMRKRMDVES